MTMDARRMARRLTTRERLERSDRWRALRDRVVTRERTPSFAQVMADPCIDATGEWSAVCVICGDPHPCDC